MTMVDQGWMALRAGDAAGAARSFQSAIYARPDDAEAWGALGVALCRTGRPQEGLQALDRAAQLAPLSPRIAYNQGRAREMCGDLQGARVAYRRTLMLDGEHVYAQTALLRLDRLEAGAGAGTVPPAFDIPPGPAVPAPGRWPAPVAPATSPPTWLWWVLPGILVIILLQVAVVGVGLLSLRTARTEEPRIGRTGERWRLDSPRYEGPSLRERMERPPVRIPSPPRFEREEPPVIRIPSPPRIEHEEPPVIRIPSPPRYEYEPPAIRIPSPPRFEREEPPVIRIPSPPRIEHEPPHWRGQWPREPRFGRPDSPFGETPRLETSPL